jgi:hypothetical protein
VGICSLSIETTDHGVHGITATNPNLSLFYTTLERIEFNTGGKCVYLPCYGHQNRFELLRSNKLHAELIDVRQMNNTKIIACSAEGDPSPGDNAGKVASDFSVDGGGQAAFITLLGGNNTIEGCVVEPNCRDVTVAAYRFGGALGVGILPASGNVFARTYA